jgi:hypothetical protein
MVDWISSKIGILLKTVSIIWNWIKSWLIRKLIGDNNCVRLDIVAEDNCIKNDFKFKLYIVNNSTDKIRLKKLYLKDEKENKIINLLVLHANNNPNQEATKWIPFEETGLKDKVLYSVNNIGSRKIENIDYLVQVGVSVRDLVNVVIANNCKTDNIKSKKGIEIFLEYSMINKKKLNYGKISEYFSLE